LEKIAIERLVREVLLDLGVSKDQVLLTDRLTNDLKVTSDDLSFVYTRNLEEKLNINIPPNEWDHVETVGDTIDLLYKYTR